MVPRYVSTADRTRRTSRIVLIETPSFNEVAQQKKAVLSSGRADGRPLLGRALDHHPGHPLDDVRAAAPRQRALGIMHLDSQIAPTPSPRKEPADLHLHRNQAADVHPRTPTWPRRSSTRRARGPSFSGLLSPNLVEQMGQGELTLEKGGVQREVTILISDIRGFNRMSEKKPPSEIVAMLNEYFEVHGGGALALNGTLDKYVGDEINGPLRRPVGHARTRRCSPCAAPSR